MSLLGRKVTIPGTVPTFAKIKKATHHFPTFAKIYGRSLLLQTDHHFFPTFAYFSSIASILFNGVEKLFFGRAFQWSKLFPPLESFPLTVPFVAAESWILYNVYQQLYDFTISFQLCLQPIVFCPTHPLLRIFRSFCFSLALCVLLSCLVQSYTSVVFPCQC